MKRLFLFVALLSIGLSIVPLIEKADISLFGISAHKSAIENYESQINALDQEIAEIEAADQLSKRDSVKLNGKFKTKETLGYAIESQQKALRKNQGVITGTIALLLLMPFLLLSGSSASQFSQEEQAWLTIPLEGVNKLLISYDKKPEDKSSSPLNINFVSRRIRIDKTLLTSKGSSKSSAFIFAFVGLPFFYFLPHIYHLLFSDNDLFTTAAQLFSGWNMLITPILFIIVGIFIFFSLGTKAHFEINKTNGTLQFRDGTKMVKRKIEDIASVQINSFVLSSNQGHTHQQYQLQLNFKDGSVKALYNHTGKEEMYVDAIKTARFLGKPFVDPVRAVETNPHFI